jgi:hypothetical protein
MCCPIFGDNIHTFVFNNLVLLAQPQGFDINISFIELSGAFLWRKVLGMTKFKIGIYFNFCGLGR